YYYPFEYYPNRTRGEYEYEFYNYKDAVEYSLNENEKYKDLDNDGILLSGIELGLTSLNFDISEEIMNDSRIDFVLASCHQLTGREDFAFLNYRNTNINSLMKEYFEELLKIASWGKFDVLSHLNYPMRYTSKAGIDVHLSEYNEIIREIFKVLIYKNCGIEVNTSGIRNKYAHCYPPLKYVKMYREMGGELITVGSDCHKLSHLGMNITDGIELVKSAGFNYITIFKNREPEFLRLN
ncbi:MAG: PHP domain-containing protein, partial [Ruminococcus sp.]|nr:PHP domain-containing protein [Ruminococcus sp.]